MHLDILVQKNMGYTILKNLKSGRFKQSRYKNKNLDVCFFFAAPCIYYLLNNSELPPSNSLFSVSVYFLLYQHDQNSKTSMYTFQMPQIFMDNPYSAFYKISDRIFYNINSILKNLNN